MTQEMSWDRLLDKKRLDMADLPQPDIHPTSGVTQYQQDAERILYATAFRRLQGKTQVHPLPVFDYLRSRLTHTIEVAHVGRMIATAVARKIKQDPTDVGDITYAACLAHDIGNPPFGHIGEYAIQTWFEEMKQDGRMGDFLNKDKRRFDFLSFDGNAQGFRLLSRLCGWRDPRGLQLSYATLGAFSKYPWSSEHAGDKKKFGFMCEDESAANRVYDALGLTKEDGKYCRHPLAYIVEAADDICYLTTDIEDAARMKLLEPVAAQERLYDIAHLGGRIPRLHELSAADPQDKIAYLRAGAVSAMIDACVIVFMERYPEIMKGMLNGSLIEASKHHEHADKIRAACRNTIYTETRKMELEGAGYNMITGLMNMYGGMILQLREKGEKGLDKKNYGFFHLLPKEFRTRLLNTNDRYKVLLVLVDYISGMTDRYCLSLYQKLTGSSVTIGRMM